MKQTTIIMPVTKIRQCLFYPYFNRLPLLWFFQRVIHIDKAFLRTVNTLKLFYNFFYSKRI
jgi:hypothetical protein